jgi:O-antigen/teichoic acid export membrane protein
MSDGKQLRSALAGIAGARVGSLVVGFVCTVLTVRIVLENYGEPTFAAVSLISTLIAVIPFADLGLGTALTNLTVAHKQGASTDPIRPAIIATVGILTAVGILIVTGSSIAAFQGHLDLAPLQQLGDPRNYVPVVSSAIAFWLLGGPAYRILYGLKRSSTVLLLQGSTSVIALGTTLLIVRAGGPPWLLAVAPIASSAVAGSVAWRLALVGLRNDMADGWRWPGAPQLKRLLAQGSSGALLLLGASMLLQTDRLLVANFGTVEQLAALAVVLPPFAAGQSLLSAAGSFLWPHYSELRLKNEQHLDTLRRHMAIASLFGLLMAVAMTALFPIYLKLVGFQEVPVQLILALSGLITLQAVGLVPSSTLTDASSLRAQGVVSLVSGISKIAIAVALIPILGATGAIIATALVVGLFQLPFYTALMTRRVDQRSPA